MTLPRIVLKPKRAAPFYARHPWLFAGTIDREEGNPSLGDEVEIVSSVGNFVARGLYNPHSKIRVRLYSWESEVALDDSFFRARIEEAIALRHDVLKLQESSAPAYRVLFSEADRLSGMIVDRYHEYLVVQFTSAALWQRRNLLCQILQDRLHPKGIVLRGDKEMSKLEGLDIVEGLHSGETPPAEILIQENGLTFAVDLGEGQKTGSYLDQRDNHLQVARLCRGKTVLDAFCYAGGFGIHAAAHGAASVESVDASETALHIAARNAELNQLSGISFVRADVFKYLEKLIGERRKFDVIVLDPPKFARHRDALPKALQGYRTLHRAALQLLTPGGILVSCCCTGLVTLEMLEELIAQTAASVRKDFQFLSRSGPAPDHPIATSCRESGYLKCIVGRCL